MFDQSLIDSAWGSTGQTFAAPQMQPAATKASGKKKKSFLVDNISTATGIAGGVVGGIAGLAAGGVGAIPGAALGSGAGSAGGELLENIISGDAWHTNVAKEGALGTVFGAGPIRGAKFGVEAVKGIAKGGGKKAVREASDEAAKFTLRGAAGRALTGKATDLATKQFGLTDKFIADYTKKYGEDAGKTIVRHGINTADEAEKVIATQQGTFNDLVAGVGDIDKKKIQTALTGIATQLAGSGPSQQKAVGEKLLAETTQLLAQYGDKIPATALNDVRQQYDKLVNYTMKQNDPATYDVNKRVADVLRRTLQEASGDTKLKDAGKELSRLYALSDEIAARAPKVEARGSSPLGFRNLLGAGIGGSIGGVGGGLPGAIAGAALVAGANSPAGRRLATNTAISGGEKLLAAGEKAGIRQQGIGNTAARIGAGGLLTNGSLNSEQPQSLEATMSSYSPAGADQTNQMPSMAPMMTDSTANMSSSYQNNPVSSSPYSKDSLLADINRDPENTDKYIAYYQQLDEIFNPVMDAGKSSLTSGQQSQAARAQNTIGDLQTLEQAISDGSLLKTAIPGSGNAFIGNALGTTNIESALFNIGDVILRNRTGATAPPEEVRKFVAGYLPRAGESREAQMYKLKRAYEEMQGMISPTEYLGQGSPQPSRLEDIYAQGAYN